MGWCYSAFSILNRCGQELRKVDNMLKAENRVDITWREKTDNQSTKLHIRKAKFFTVYVLVQAITRHESNATYDFIKKFEFYY